MSIISLSVESSVRLYRDDVPSVVSPYTGRIWMDRNLGALRVAQTITDVDALGWLYQWGRGSDGHQIRTSSTTATLSATSNPGNNLFITGTVNPFDWMSPAQDGSSWQGVNGVNNPCPAGYRIPTNAEWVTEINSLSPKNITTAFDSFLKLPAAGQRTEDGSIVNVGSHGFYAVSDTNTGAGYRQASFFVIFTSTALGLGVTLARGNCVRCIKN